MNWKTLIRGPVARPAILVIAQVALTTLGYYAAFGLRYEFRIPTEGIRRFAETLPYLLALRLALSHYFRLDKSFWRHVGLRDLMQLTAATTVGSLMFPITLLALNQIHGLSFSIFALEWIMAIGLSGGVRMAVRLIHERMHLGFSTRLQGKRVFIIGAGEAGEQILRQIQHDSQQRLCVLGLIDDDPAKRGWELHGVPVLGTADELRGLVAMHNVTQILIAIPTATPNQLRRLVERCMETGAEVQLVPPLEDLIRGDVHLSELREVQIEDLLGREPVNLDLQAIEPDIAGKVVLVTGAGGSIGSELARQLARFHPSKLVLLERAESPLYFIHLEVAQRNPEIDVVPVLASVTNADRLQDIFQTHQPELVFHAAAYKHVPMLEWNVVEGVWNNVVGSLLVARCAAQAGVRKMVLISTDKAVNPSSILGATKRIAERIVLELPSLRASSTDFRVVRFGNVLGSDGSVVPLFKKQLAAGGPLTVTHPDVRRYFMTIPEAVQLVLQATALPECAGRIALLEMGTQVRVLELAEQLIRLAGLVPHKDIKIMYTGLRPGEKMLEELVAPNEEAVSTSSDKIQVVERKETDGNALAQRLRALIRVTSRQERNALIRALASIVPEYQPAGLLESTFHRNGNHHRNGHTNGNGNGHRSGNGSGNVNGNGNLNGNGNGREPKPRRERLEEFRLRISPPTKLRNGTSDRV